MAASLAQGTTTIYNAACEPYVQQLCLMLNSMGAKISGIGSNLLTIKWCWKKCILVHTQFLPDMIDIGGSLGIGQSWTPIRDYYFKIVQLSSIRYNT